MFEHRYVKMPSPDPKLVGKIVTPHNLDYAYYVSQYSRALGLCLKLGPAAPLDPLPVLYSSTVGSHKPKIFGILLSDRLTDPFLFLVPNLNSAARVQCGVPS